MRAVLRRAETFAAALEQRPAAVLTVLSVAYWTAVVMTAMRRPLWSDEVFSYYVALQPSLASIWNVLATGLDTMPPLDYWMRHLLMQVFGNSELAFRMWSCLATWGACLALYAFVRRRSSVLLGISAFLIPLSLYSYYYAQEGRPYAPLLGFSALALLCWQLSVNGARWAVPLLALSISAAMWSHYYGVLVWPALGAGELVRSLGRRRMDWPVAGALLFAAATPIVLLPLIRIARDYSVEFWTPVSIAATARCYEDIFEAAIVPAIAFLFLLPIASADEGRGQPASRPHASWPFHELVAAAALLGIPMLAYIVARLGTNALWPRYVLPTVLGPAILLPFAAHRWFSRRVTDLALTASLALGFAGNVWAQYVRANAAQASAAEWRTRIAELTRNAPVLATNFELFNEVQHYRPDLKPRLFSAADWSRRTSKSLALQSIKRIAGANTVDESVFYRRTPEFYLIARDANTSIEALRRLGLLEGASFEWLGQFGDSSLLYVRVPAAARNARAEPQQALASKQPRP